MYLVIVNNILLLIDIYNFNEFFNKIAIEYLKRETGYYSFFIQFLKLINRVNFNFIIKRLFSL